MIVLVPFQNCYYNNGTEYRHFISYGQMYVTRCGITLPVQRTNRTTQVQLLAFAAWLLPWRLQEGGTCRAVKVGPGGTSAATSQFLAVAMRAWQSQPLSLQPAVFLPGFPPPLSRSPLCLQLILCYSMEWSPFLPSLANVPPPSPTHLPPSSPSSPASPPQWPSPCHPTSLSYYFRIKQGEFP